MSEVHNVSSCWSFWIICSFSVFFKGSEHYNSPVAATLSLPTNQSLYQTVGGAHTPIGLKPTYVVNIMSGI